MYTHRNSPQGKVRLSGGYYLLLLCPLFIFYTHLVWRRNILAAVNHSREMCTYTCSSSVTTSFCGGTFFFLSEKYFASIKTKVFLQFVRMISCNYKCKLIFEILKILRCFRCEMKETRSTDVYL